ncbi:DUF4062 domain-containing protein [Lyngbya confervoides]|uniref:DUF4062 domain-containing protein n=1 Tax=Lyngbya confervoides BDU141951 TaxID=1574623 RepID=A0ABD4T1V2_9CYAN|nr:DUF4062 domain-containing protein [Lyngbya confervoides]MCM1982410.1 DUF4062 domain-containing protein [Lyngbya confervoides BDU141951]
MLKNLLGYSFYKIDQASEKAKEIRPEFGQEMKAEYLLRVADLATEITDQLKTFHAGNEDSSLNGAEELDKRRTVYLAETTGDLQGQRDRIKRELEQMNYRVLPDRPLPADANLRSDVKKYLEQSTLSIHLVGARYGVVPEGEERSSIVVQHELAVDQAQQDTHFQRVVWLSPEGQKLDPRIEKIRQNLRNDAELLQLSIEDLKSHIQEKLKQLQPISSPQSPPPELIRIYLICDRNDREDIAPVEDFLFDQGYEILTPMFGEEAQEVRRQEHEAYLEMCDAVLIYYGAGDERWQREQIQYLRKVAGLTHRTRPLLAKAILKRDPSTQPKQQLRTREAIVLESFGAFEPEVLAPFLDAIAQGQRGATP